MPISKYASAALDSACSTVSACGKGQRNGVLNTESFGIGQLVGADLLEYTEAEQALLSSALSNGMDRHEAQATIKSGLRSGMRNPRDVPNEPKVAPSTPKRATTAELATRWYGEAKPIAGTLAERYLREVRGITGALPDTLRYHSHIWHSGAKEELPALIAPITRMDADGSRITAAHVTYLDPATAHKTKADPAKKMYGDVKGGAIWLSDCGPHMLIAEGIEKALFCQQAANLPAVAGLSATLLPKIIWPRATQKVTICADPNGAGERALRLAANAWAADNIVVYGCYPPIAGRDWDECPADAVCDAIADAKPFKPPPPPEPPKTLDALASADDFQRNEAGQILKNEGNVLRALTCSGIKLSYDEFAWEYRIEGLDGYGPDLNDDALDELYLMLQREYAFKPTWEDFRRIVRSSARRARYHPVRDYLASLDWDGIERLDEWLIAYAGAADTPFVRAVGRIILIAAVRRVRQPGCKFDEMAVFESVEGRDKSTAWATLASDDWFTDEAPLTAETRVVIERLRGQWIVECADLKGMRAADIEHLKAFLSRRIDAAAMKYERETTKYRRQCIFVGTTNEEDYLRSATGNRRFWPIRIERFDIPALQRDRDQLWAEAAYWETKGESIRLPEELWETARQEQAAREEIDSWDNLVSDWLEAELRDTRTILDELYRTTIPDVAKAIGIKPENIDTRVEKRLMRSMRRAGWEPYRSHGKRFWRQGGCEG